MAKYGYNSFYTSLYYVTANKKTDKYLLRSEVTQTQLQYAPFIIFKCNACSVKNATDAKTVNNTATAQLHSHNTEKHPMISNRQWRI